MFYCYLLVGIVVVYCMFKALSLNCDLFSNFE